MKPHLTYSADQDIFEAISGSRSLLSRSVLLLDTLCPVTGLVGGKGAVPYFHPVDLVVVGANSLLGALVTRAATRQGKRVFFACSGGLDGFPEGLFEDRLFRQMLTDMVKLDGPTTGQEWERRLAESIASDINFGQVLISGSGAPLQLGNGVVAPRLVLFGGTQTVAARSEHEFAHAFRHLVRERAIRTGVKSGHHRRTAVLSPAVVVTSMVEGFGLHRMEEDDRGVEIFWEADGVSGLGTARRQDQRVKDAVPSMIADVVAATLWGSSALDEPPRMLETAA